MQAVRGHRGVEEQEESGTMVPYMPLQRLSQTRRIDLRNARSLKNKSHPSLNGLRTRQSLRICVKDKHDMYKMSLKRRSLDCD